MQYLVICMLVPGCLTLSFFVPLWLFDLTDLRLVYTIDKGSGLGSGVSGPQCSNIPEKVRECFAKTMCRVPFRCPIAPVKYPQIQHAKTFWNWTLRDRHFVPVLLRKISVAYDACWGAFTVYVCALDILSWLILSHGLLSARDVRSFLHNYCKVVHKFTGAPYCLP